MSDYGQFGDVKVTVDDDRVATMEIERGPNNFFDIGLIDSLAEALEKMDADDAVRAAVLCSQGKNFCAGANFNAPGDPSRDADGKPRHLYDEAVRLFSTKTPVVAAVQGAAVGGGLGLCLWPDFRIAAPEARFTANFARLGFHQGFGLSATLPRLVGQQRANEMFYTGRRVKGEEAAQIGLAEKLVPLDQLRDAAHEMAAEIAMSAPLAVGSIRETMRGDLPAAIRAATDREKQEQDWLRKTGDWKEGVKAMTERRTPDFKGA